jgi:hypothetical protein
MNNDGNESDDRYDQYKSSIGRRVIVRTHVPLYLVVESARVKRMVV